MLNNARMSNDATCLQVVSKLCVLLTSSLRSFLGSCSEIWIITVFIVVVCRLNNIIIIAGLCCDGLGESSSRYP